MKETCIFQINFEAIDFKLGCTLPAFLWQFVKHVTVSVRYWILEPLRSMYHGNRAYICDCLPVSLLPYP
jgi:hypothetical protein